MLVLFLEILFSLESLTRGGSFLSVINALNLHPNPERSFLNAKEMISYSDQPRNASTVEAFTL